MQDLSSFVWQSVQTLVTPFPPSRLGRILISRPLFAGSLKPQRQHGISCLFFLNVLNLFVSSQPSKSYSSKTYSATAYGGPLYQLLSFLSNLMGHWYVPNKQGPMIDLVNQKTKWVVTPINSYSCYCHTL